MTEGVDEIATSSNQKNG